MSRRILIVCLLVVASDQSVLARESIPSAYRQIARQHGIPADVFYAVALTESGKRDGTRPRPWPWTLNIAGEGQYFPSRLDAWRALDTTLRDGEDRVDIGLMQINWRYHETLLKSSWLALDPYRNLQLAADILIACYRARRDWWASVGCYHAPADAVRARRYRERVVAHWWALQGSR